MRETRHKKNTFSVLFAVCRFRASLETHRQAQTLEYHSQSHSNNTHPCTLCTLQSQVVHAIICICSIMHNKVSSGCNSSRRTPIRELTDATTSIHSPADNAKMHPYGSYISPFCVLHVRQRSIPSNTTNLATKRSSLANVFRARARCDDYTRVKYV